ncbi:MAG: DUF2157 domain-containing protein [Myxococcota bacterium]
MPSERFTRELDVELGRWVEDGIVDREAAERIRARYTTPSTAGEESGRSDRLGLGTTLLGVLLIAGGVLSLVAWNWGSIPAWARVTLVVVLMLTADGMGARVYPRSRLSHGLFSLATLLFGAVLGVVMQALHQTPPWWQTALSWSAVAWVQGAVFQFVPALVFSLGLAFVGLTGTIRHESGHILAAWLFAVPVVSFLPFALRHRSNALWLMGSCSVVLLMMVAGVEREALEAADVGVLILALIGLWAAAGVFFEWATPSGWLSLVGGLSVFFVLGFREVADDMVRSSPSPMHLFHALFVFMAGGVLVALHIRRERGLGLLPVRLPAVHFIAALGAALGLLLAWSSIQVVVLVHGILLMLLGLLIAEAERIESRGPFWLALAVGVVVVLVRFFEYQTGLLAKGVAFLSSGVLVVLAGLWFERRIGETE